jgi:hypothetical protein
VENHITGDIVTDLVRSGWIVEAARSEVYARWAGHVPRFDASARRARERARIIEADLAGRTRTDDRDLVQPHAEWIRRLAGRDFVDVPFGDIFVTRLGDWVEAHVCPFIAQGVARMEEIGRAERAELELPESMPPPEPLEPLETPHLEPPGPVRFRFAILGDLHFGSPTGEVMARAAIDDINGAGVDLVIQLGDVTDHGNREEFELGAKIISELDVPCVTMMGNHDVYSYQEERLSGREYYSRSFGREPDGVLLEHKGIRFAVLDSAEHGASPFAPFDIVTGTFMEGRGGAVVRGSFTPAQHEILAEVATPGAPPCFAFLHHPPQPFTGFPPVLFGLRDQDTGRLHATCDSGNVWGVFAGHTHRNARTRTFGTVPAQEVAIPRDFPFGFALVDVCDEGYAYRFVQISDHELLARMGDRASAIHRRYGLGSPEERAFVWRPPPRPS